MEGQFASHAPNSWSINWLLNQIQNQRILKTIAYQPQLRPELPCVTASKDYFQQRDLFVRVDEILLESELELEFIRLSMEQRGFDLDLHSAKQIDRFSRTSVLALRSNIARHIIKEEHRDFCIRVPDSAILAWFLQIGRVEGVKAFAKSTSDRFAHWLDEPNLHAINAKLIALLAGTETDTVSPIDLGLVENINFDDIFFDSTCLKAPIHFPVD